MVALPGGVGGGAEVEGRGGVGQGSQAARPRQERGWRCPGWRTGRTRGARCAFVEGVVDRVPSYFFDEVGVDGVVRGAVQCGCEVYGEL